MSNGLPAELLTRLKNSLSRSDFFNTNTSLMPLFRDNRITLWRDGLPTADNRTERINSLIDYLLEKQNIHQEYGLVLFLLVLRDNIPDGDNFKIELDQLVHALNEFCGGPPIPPLLLSSSPPPPPPPLPPAPELAEIHDQLKRGRVLLLIGGDLPSNITGVSSKQELAQGLAAKYRLSEAKSLAWVAQQVMSNQNRFAFTQYLHDQLNPFGKSPQPFQQAIGQLVEKYQLETVFTTAYDQQIEDAFRQARKRVNRVVTDAQLSLASPNQITLIKLLGHWEDPENLLVTEQDLSQFIHGQVKRSLIDEFRTSLRRNSLLMVGQDPRESSLLVLLDQVAGTRFQLPAYAIWSGLSQVETNSFASNRNLKVLESDPVKTLQDLIAN